MSQINSLLNIGTNALLTQQQALNVTGNNIANVNTPGYSRQRLVITSRGPVPTAYGPLGGGAVGKTIERVYDRYVGVQINNESAQLGRWAALKGGLQRVEYAFSETDGYGLNQALGEMWNAWRDLSLNPSGQTERAVLISQSQMVAETFRSMDAELSRAQAEIDTALGDGVDEINRLSAQVAALNAKITATERQGLAANEYRDQRELALQELAELVAIDTYEDAAGNVSVTMGNGRALVAGGGSFELSTTTNAAGHLDLYWNAAGGGADVTAEIGAGKLKGWLEARDDYIGAYRQRLDELAAAVIEEVNDLHATGWGLDGVSGRDFFSGSGAGDIAVHADILADADRVAAAASAAGVPGDNANAISIAELEQGLTMSGGSATFSGYLGSLVSDVGHDTRRAETFEGQQQTALAQVRNYRESVSGVSLDEEMVNLLKYQAAYEAAAKMITAADEMLETLMGLVR